MSTFIPGPLTRPQINRALFADITDAAILDFTGGLTFDADLAPEDVARIWARMESIDDTDLATRATLRAQSAALLELAAVAPRDPLLDALVAAVQALTCYALGDPTPTPEPAPPEPVTDPTEEEPLP